MSALTEIFGTNNDVTAADKSRQLIPRCVDRGWANYPPKYKFTGPRQTANQRKEKQRNE